DQPTATLTILNDDSGISFAAAESAINEDVTGGTAFIHVLRQGSTRGTASVDFRTTTNGTAVIGTNYLAVTNTITFQPGYTDLSVRIPIIRDPRVTGNKTVVMALTNAVKDLWFTPYFST